MNEDISRWLDEIHGAREAVGVTAAQYPDAVILAFIDVESDGDPFAHRPGSQFYGLLQMGRAAGLDVGIDDVSELDGEDGDPETEDDFEAFLRLCERYSDVHDYSPMMIAVLWKGGVGTAKVVRRLVSDSGADTRSAIAQAERRLDIPNLVEYTIRRFRSSLVRWGRWVDEQNAPLGVCANEVIRADDG